MRTTYALALGAIVGLVVPSFAQTTSAPGRSPDSATTSGSDVARPTEGRAATHDGMKSGSPNGNGNALEGPNHAPDATRNNGQ